MHFVHGNDKILEEMKTFIEKQIEKIKEILDINDITGENERVDENGMDEEIEFQSDGDEKRF